MSAPRGGTPLLALCVVACGTPSAQAPREPVGDTPVERANHEDEPREAEVLGCAALPPGGITEIRYTVHHYETPEQMERYFVYDAAEPCPSDPMPGHLLTTYAPRVCVPIDAQALSTLGRQIEADGVASITVVRESGVHRGGVELELLHRAGSCRIADVTSDLRVIDADRARFRAIAERVRARMAETLGS